MTESVCRDPPVLPRSPVSVADPLPCEDQLKQFSKGKNSGRGGFLQQGNIALRPDERSHESGRETRSDDQRFDNSDDAHELPLCNIPLHVERPNLGNNEGRKEVEATGSAKQSEGVQAGRVDHRSGDDQNPLDELRSTSQDAGYAKEKATEEAEREGETLGEETRSRPDTPVGRTEPASEFEEEIEMNEGEPLPPDEAPNVDKLHQMKALYNTLSLQANEPQQLNDAVEKREARQVGQHILNKDEHTDWTDECTSARENQQAGNKEVPRHETHSSPEEDPSAEETVEISPKDPGSPHAEEELDVKACPPPLITALRKLATSQNADPTRLEKLLTPSEIGNSIQETYPTSLISATFEAMLRHAEIVRVQTTGARILNHAARLPLAAAAIGEAKGVQLLVHTMLLHKESLAIQVASTAALTSVCTTRENRLTAASFFACEAVTSSTRTFCDDMKLQAASLALLSSIAMEPENDGHLHRVGSARVPLRVLKRHRREMGLVSAALHCMHVMLSRGGLTAVGATARMQPVKLLLGSMVGFPDETRIQTTALSCVARLIEVDEEARRMCAYAHGAELCVRNMRRFRGRGYARLHVACMQTLCALAQGGMERIVLASGGMEAALTCMIEWRGVFGVQMCGLELLERFVAMGDEIVDRVHAVGGLEVLSAGLKAHIAREEFVERGVKVMRVLRR